MVKEIDAFRTAKLLLDAHCEQEAWRILTLRALDEHLAGNTETLGITLQVEAALRVLTDPGAGRTRQ